MSNQDERLDLDETIQLALAESVAGPEPRPEVKAQLLAQLSVAALPPGFSVRLASEDDWMPHPVPGIRMKVLAANRRSGYATLLLDVASGTRFPAHDHDGDEECYVISGSVMTVGRRLGPGDFIHANEGTHHEALWTDEGARVLLVVPISELPA
jgi:quercetin dioxygenase-like cupin family protein